MCASEVLKYLGFCHVCRRNSLETRSQHPDCTCLGPEKSCDLLAGVLEAEVCKLHTMIWTASRETLNFEGTTHGPAVWTC